MRVTWVPSTEYNDARPAFTYTDEERAELIRALETLVLTTAVRDQGDILKRMLATHKSIDAAITAMRHL
jgi:hypothetical protein